MLTFQCVGIGKKTWTPSEEEVSRWTAAYPAVDLEAELRKMEAWIMANPRRRKTASGMPRFVVNWLNSSQNKGLASRPARPAQARVFHVEQPKGGVTEAQSLRAGAAKSNIPSVKRRLLIEAAVLEEHPDWTYRQRLAEIAARFNAEEA